MPDDELSYEECDRIAAEVRAAQKAATGSADIRNRQMVHALIRAGAKREAETPRDTTAKTFRQAQADTLAAIARAILATGRRVPFDMELRAAVDTYDAATRREAARAEPQFPDGKLNDDDEGALDVAIGTESGRVVFRFPHRVAWFACPPEQALDIAETLIGHAVALGVKRPVTIALGARVAKPKTN